MYHDLASYEYLRFPTENTVTKGYEMQDRIRLNFIIHFLDCGTHAELDKAIKCLDI